MCLHLHPYLVVGYAHSHVGLELKPYPVPVTIGTLESDIRTFHTQCFNLITFLADAEPEARYGLPRCPTFRRVFCVAFYGPYWPCTKKNYLRSWILVFRLTPRSCRRNHLNRIYDILKPISWTRQATHTNHLVGSLPRNTCDGLVMSAAISVFNSNLQRQLHTVYENMAMKRYGHLRNNIKHL